MQFAIHISAGTLYGEVAQGVIGQLSIRSQELVNFFSGNFDKNVSPLYCDSVFYLGSGRSRIVDKNVEIAWRCETESMEMCHGSCCCFLNFHFLCNP